MRSRPGILMLDAQLCPMYANVAAQDLLAFSLNMSARPSLRRLSARVHALIAILQRALETGECLADRELTLKPPARRASRAPSTSP